MCAAIRLTHLHIHSPATKSLIEVRQIDFGGRSQFKYVADNREAKRIN